MPDLPAPSDPLSEVMAVRFEELVAAVEAVKGSMLEGDWVRAESLLGAVIVKSDALKGAMRICLPPGRGREG